VIAEVPAAVWAGAIALLAGIATATINGRFQLRTVATQKTSSDTSTVIAGFEKLTQALERTVADLRGEVRAADSTTSPDGRDPPRHLLGHQSALTSARP
jgi:hypothetical protein